MTEYNSNYFSICDQKNKEDMVLFQTKLNMSSTKTLCRVLRGNLNVITDVQNQNNVLALAATTNCDYRK